MKMTEHHVMEPSDGLRLDQKAFRRRKFLRYSGMAGAAVAAGSLLTLESCHKDILVPGGVSFGTGDVAILNYAYSLEQLEAAFYTQVIATPYSEMSALERTILTDLRDHEIAHREFFKDALGSSAIPDLQVNFSLIDFSSRLSVLLTSKMFEDLGVSAYNGSGRYLTSADHLLLAGKIVSVEARHAAVIRDLLVYNSFADRTIVNSQGLDVTRKPREVLAIAAPFITTPLDASTLPA